MTHLTDKLNCMYNECMTTVNTFPSWSPLCGVSNEISAEQIALHSSSYLAIRSITTFRCFYV